MWRCGEMDFCVASIPQISLPIFKIIKGGTNLRPRFHNWTWVLTASSMSTMTVSYLTWILLYLISRFSAWAFIYSVVFLLDTNQPPFSFIFYPFFFQRISPTIVFLALKWNIDATYGDTQSQLYSLLNRFHGLVGDYIFPTYSRFPTDVMLQAYRYYRRATFLSSTSWYNYS